MFELVQAGGWRMLPIILCFIVAIAIVIERFLERTIARSGAYSVNGQLLSNAMPVALRTVLEQASAGDQRLATLIAAEAGPSHQSVVSAMDILGRMGFTRINIATRQPDDRND